MGSITRERHSPSPDKEIQLSVSPQAPTLSLIRHGQAEHNIDPVADVASEFDAPASKWRGCVDFDLVSAEEWGGKTGKWACDEETVEHRARETRQWLRQKMRQLILNQSPTPNAGGHKRRIRGDCVLVTHGGFPHRLTENWEGFDAGAG